MQNLPPSWSGPANSGCPGVLSSTASSSCPWEVQHSHGTAAQHHQPLGRALWPKNTRASTAGHGKSASISLDLPVLLPSRSPPLLQRDTVIPTYPLEKPQLQQRRPTNKPALGKNSPAVPRQTLCGHGKYNSTKRKKTTSKMKKLRNHPQLNQQEISPKAVDNDRPVQSDRLGVQKGNSENTEGIKRRYEQ